MCAHAGLAKGVGNLGQGVVVGVAGLASNVVEGVAATADVVIKRAPEPLTACMTEI